MIGVASLCVAVYHFVSESLQQRVTLLTGPEGSFNSEIGETLHDQFLQQPAWRLWGRSFDLTVHDTNGSQQNRSRVDRDQQGRLLGIALDGFANTPNVRTMLHLTDIPLLVLASPTFLAKAADAKASHGFGPIAAQAFFQKLLLTKPTGTVADAAPVEITFAQIADYFQNHRDQPHRFYLGPVGSGTRTLAKTVLDSYKIPWQDVDRFSQLDFVQAAYGIQDERLDVAFFLLPTQTDFIVEMLRRGNARLVGLDQTEGFVSNNHYLHEQTLTEGLFGSNMPSRPLATVQARVVLICSKSMPNNDAYWLTRSIANFLVQDEAIGPSLAADLTPGANRTSYEMHEGARMFHEQREPWYIAGSRQSIHWLLGTAGALALTLLAAVAQPYVSQFFGPRATSGSGTQSESPPAEKPAPQAFGEAKPDTPSKLQRQADELCTEIESVSPPATADQIAAFSDRLDDLDRAVRAAKPSSKREASSLGHAIHVLSEAKQALDQLAAVIQPTEEQPAIK
jgi:TRAP-type uncharacterized transport system substrate-binding protein